MVERKRQRRSVVLDYNVVTTVRCGCETARSTLPSPPRGWRCPALVGPALWFVRMQLRDCRRTEDRGSELRDVLYTHCGVSTPHSTQPADSALFRTRIPLRDARELLLRGSYIPNPPS
ncbi:Hypp949 [Branchiostoma lanceolatum]|uniref:Hypp949 protein n=1 Tax=Branchiostoma lanceolatum TaxID=7740 RepID=A0A8J9ZF85_BRALA|nr:Hypp949 [Branchiostoma lanceolatum]